MIKHIVLLKMKPQTPDATIAEIDNALAGLKNRISGILDYLWGPYSSDEGLNHGYTHGFIMTFDTTASRDAYLPHPEHEKVKTLVLEHVDGALAFDFEA